MNEKDLKRLGRQELVDMIMKLENEKAELSTLNDTLKAESEKLAAELESQKSVVCDADNIGSLADAVVGITGIIAKAQETADLYAEEAKRMRDKAERDSQQMISEADAAAKSILSQANIDSDCIKANAKAEADVQWQQFNAKVNEVLQAHAELSVLLGRQ